MKSNPTKMRKAMRLLAKNNRCVQDVANRLKVHRTTIWRWFNAPGMEEYYMECVYEELDRKFANR